MIEDYIKNLMSILGPDEQAIIDDCAIRREWENFATQKKWKKGDAARTIKKILQHLEKPIYKGPSFEELYKEFVALESLNRNTGIKSAVHTYYDNKEQGGNIGNMKRIVDALSQIDYKDSTDEKIEDAIERAKDWKYLYYRDTAGKIVQKYNAFDMDFIEEYKDRIPHLKRLYDDLKAEEKFKRELERTGM